MKELATIKILIILFFLLSCNSKKNIEYYKSSKNSFKKNFFLTINDENATIYGWEIQINKDTIYYKSKGVLKKNKNGTIGITFKKFEVTKSMINLKNLNNFKNDSILNYLNINFYLSFFNGKILKKSIDFFAVKHIYLDRVDRFVFEKIK